MNNFDSLEEIIIDEIMMRFCGSCTSQDEVEFIVNSKLERIAQLLVDSVSTPKGEE
jgi:hypothetical protein